MKQSILVDIGKLQERQMGFVVALTYQYSQLCVKADPTLLLGVVLRDNGLEKNIEDLAQVMLYQEEEKQDIINLVPKNSNDEIQILSQGIAETYPEIIQSVESYEPDDNSPEVAEQRKAIEKQYNTTLPESEKSYYLKLTMPEVNDDRKKLLEDAVTVIHDAIKTRMDATLAFYSASISVKSAGETPEELKAIKEQLDSVNKQYEDMREQFTDNKMKEIQAANDRYHKKEEEKRKQNEVEPDADKWKTLTMQ